jgi:hypothetical protein
MTPDRVKVQCANPQPTLAGACTWKGIRQAARIIVGWDGRSVQLSPIHKRCPRCGGPVKQAVP